MLEVLKNISAAVWGSPLLILILSVGIFLSIKTRFAQIRLFPKALRQFLRQFNSEVNEDGVSSYQALCTALAATVGTGNLAGVAGAIAIGGPGAIFWMWVCAFFGMVIKFAEATLAVRFRQRNEHGEYVGGPMYMICNGLGKKWRPMAYVYCFFGVVASFGVGNATQINTLVSSVNTTVQVAGGASSVYGNVFIGLVLAVLVWYLLSGGAVRIGRIAEKLIPFVSVGYILLCVVVLIVCFNAIPGALHSIFYGAFSPRAVTGGVIGTMLTAVRIGASRGVFTNEAGMGTAAIAHASGNVKDPTDQGLMGIIEVFIDTMLICTLTALVILCAPINIDYGFDTGIALTIKAFSSVYGGWVSFPITIALCALAIATILGWGLYGARCAQFLFGDGVWKKFVYFQVGMVVIGAVVPTDTVWLFADIVNGLMAIPNLIALILLSEHLRDMLNPSLESHQNARRRELK